VKSAKQRTYVIFLKKNFIYFRERERECMSGGRGREGENLKQTLP